MFESKKGKNVENNINHMFKSIAVRENTPSYLLLDIHFSKRSKVYLQKKNLILFLMYCLKKDQ